MIIYLLDTSALLAPRDNEPGAGRVAELLERAQANRSAWIAAAQKSNAILIDNDPEFEALAPTQEV